MLLAKRSHRTSCGVILKRRGCLLDTNMEVKEGKTRRDANKSKPERTSDAHQQDIGSQSLELKPRNAPWPLLGCDITHCDVYCMTFQE